MDVGTEPRLCASRVELSQRFQYLQKYLKKVQVALNGAVRGTSFSPKDFWWAFMQHPLRNKPRKQCTPEPLARSISTLHRRAQSIHVSCEPRRALGVLGTRARAIPPKTPRQFARLRP